MDTIKIDVKLVTTTYDNDEKQYNDLITTVYINGDKVKWNFVEVFDFFVDVMNIGVNVSYWAEPHARNKITYYMNKHSLFEPFSCSCGASGCAGIWNGILTKHRKHTVEWRAEKEDGYKFIKRFYSFDKNQYYSEVKKAWNTLVDMFDRGVVVEYHGQDELLYNRYKNYYVFDSVEQYFKE